MFGGKDMFTVRRLRLFNLVGLLKVSNAQSRKFASVSKAGNFARFCKMRNRQLLYEENRRAGFVERLRRGFVRGLRKERIRY